MNKDNMSIFARLLLVAVALFAHPAFAQDLSPVTDMLDTVVEALTGPIGRLIGIIAIVGAGIMMLIGRLNWMIFVGIFVGIVLIFSAAAIVDGFAT